MRYFCFGIWIFCLIAFSHQGLAQEFDEQFTYLGTSETLSETSITSFYQDTRGFMWLGTNLGLLRYDGRSFFPINAHEAGEINLNNCFVRSLLIDKDSLLWIGSQEGILFKYSLEENLTERYEFSSEAFSSNDYSILSLLEDEAGNLWVGTQQGLYLFDKDSLKFRPLVLDSSFPGKEEVAIQAMCEDDYHNIWLGTDQGLFKWNPERVKGKWYVDELTEGDSTATPAVISMYESQGSVFIATRTNIFQAIHQHEKLVPIFSISDISLTQAYSIKGDIQVIIGDLKEHLWIGTFGGGLIQLELSSRNVRTYLNEESKLGSLRNNNIISLYLDASGLLWVGTFSGINTLNLNRIQFDIVPENPDLISRDVYAITKDKKKGLWLSTDMGLAHYPWDSTKMYNNSRKPTYYLKDEIIFALYADEDGNVWAGSDENGLFVLTYEDLMDQRIQFKRIFPKNNSFPSFDRQKILSLNSHPDYGVLVGTGNGAYHVSLNSQRQRMIWDNDSSSGLPPVYSIYCDRLSRYWLGTDEGAICLESTNENGYVQYKKVLFSNDSLNSLVYSIHQDTDGDIWFGTEGQGIFRISTDSMKYIAYNIRDVLFDNVIYGISEDQAGYLWLSTNRGLCRAVKSPIDQKVNFIPFNSLNSNLPVNEFYPGAYFKDKDQRLYFGSSRGAITFKLDVVANGEVPPPVVITDFQLFFEPAIINVYGEVGRKGEVDFENERWIGGVKEITLNHTQNVLYFEFSAMSFIDHEANQYAYKLEGADEEWIYSRDKYSATYTYLDPGNYTFKVKAANHNGIWNEWGTSLKIRITPPFYQTTAFYIMLGILGFMIVLAYIRYQERNRRKLEKKVELRTEELFKKKEELEHTLEELKHMQSQLVENEKMASLGQLTAGVAHEINNPITFVIGNVNPLKRDVEDLMQVLNEYEQLIRELGLGKRFDRVQKLKENLEYDYIKEEIWDLLAGIEEGANRTSHIVKGLRNFSRLDEDQLKLADVNEGIESTLLILKSQFKNRIDIVRSFGEIPKVICYPGKLNQVYMNVISNAIQAIVDKGKIEIGTKSDGKYVTISIKDNGKGMSEEVRKRIFEPFFTTKEVGQGTGLGLAITFGIIQDHEGRIDVQSKSGVGTMFIIHLPIAGPQQQENIQKLSLN